MRFTLLILLFITTQFIFSQSKFTLSDQEYQKLHDKSRLLINSNVDSSFIIASKIEKSNNYLHRSFACGIKSYLFQLKGDSIKSKRYFKQSFTYLDQIPISKDKLKLNAYLLNFGGLSEWKRGNLGKSLNLYHQGKKISEKANDIELIIKFNSNISNIYGETKNYALAIKTAKESDKELNRNQFYFTKEKFEQNKSNIYINLGVFYDHYFESNKLNKVLLDSAEYYYKKSILYSKNLIDNKIAAQICLANINSIKGKNKNAELNYREILLLTKKEGFDYRNYNTLYNLGYLYYKQKKFEESMLCFKQIDSIYKLYKQHPNEYYQANYFLANIHSVKDDLEPALLHYKVYLNYFENAESKSNKEANAINNFIFDLDTKAEVILLQKKHTQKLFTQRIFKVGFILAVLIIILILVQYYLDKKKTNIKVKRLIEEFKNNNSNKFEIKNAILNDLSLTITKENSKNNLVIDIEKEKEILYKIKKIEEKLEYLKEDYTLQYVAKKIKTNTTYLSYVINKNFNKTFSEYNNELKINYVINQLITNLTYRKYSTQAIAESAGFKNASSFSKSFSKRTGLTPAQFAKNI